MYFTISESLCVHITVECSSNLSFCLMEWSCPKEDTSMTSEETNDNILHLRFVLQHSTSLAYSH